MIFELIEPLSNLWEKVKSYAAGCSWKAGKSLARDMDNHMFSNWERVIVALEGEKSVAIVPSPRRIVFPMFPTRRILDICLLMNNIVVTV